MPRSGWTVVIGVPADRIDVSLRRSYTFLNHVRERERARGRGRLPAVAVTAYASLEDRERALAAGFQAWVAKPVEPETLVDLVAKTASSAG